MEEVKERKQIRITMVFRNDSGVLEAPTKIAYELLDVSTITTIIPRTEVATSSSTVNVIITASQNSAINSNLAYETKLFSVEWYSGATLIGNEDCFYKVKNMIRIPLPV